MRTPLEPAIGVETLRVSIGLSNAFAKQPPTRLSCSLNGYNPGSHGLPGRFRHWQAVYRFQRVVTDKGLPMNETITPRRFVSKMDSDIPKHWLPGNEVVSSLLNAYTILVPANEGFYVRTLKACMPHLHDARLRERCAQFIRQEAQHGVAHVRYWDNLDDQGYRFRAFERNVDRLVFRTMEKLGPLWLRVSLVSCVEHINAYLSHEFLSQNVLADADPRIKDLMEWHFAEEIEHRRVAFDLLQHMAPSYPARVLGFALTVGLFYLLMGGQAIALLRQDGLLWRKKTWVQIRSHLGAGHHMFKRTLRHLLDYLRPGFHPSQMADDAMALKVLTRLAATAPPTVVATQRSQWREWHQAA